MPQKPRRTKGVHPPKRISERREQPLDRRVAICRTIGQTSAAEEERYWAQQENPPSKRTINKIRARAKEAWGSEGTRNGAKRRPLADITFSQNKPRGAKKKLTDEQERYLRNKALSSREERRKTADEHCSDLYMSHNISISPSLFTATMYRGGICRKKAEYKPILTQKHKDERVERAQELLKILKGCIGAVCFMDAASIRLNEDKADYCWQGKDEGYHEDVKIGTNKNKDYSCAQFFGVVAHGVKNGPCAALTKETADEKAAAQREVDRLNKEEYMDRFLGATFIWAMAARERDEEERGHKFRGSKPREDIWIRDNNFKRGNRDAGGVDWYRVNYEFLLPKVKPWYYELEKTRPAFQLAMDNAGPHNSACSDHLLNMAKIVRFLWPPQSPDMNPIEQIWAYIRKQIRNRRKTGNYPKNNEEIIAAWIEEWQKVPQWKIDQVIEHTIEVCERIICKKGDNTFHS